MATKPIPLSLHTLYAELVDRCAEAAFEESFSENGSFVVKTVRGRRYWYFQPTTVPDRPQRYVGPETPELLERIARHRERHSDRRERRTLVSTLLRHVPSARPDRRIGELVAALAQAGVFRLRAVLVGTVAYQIYGPMLGLRLPHAGVRTGDLDIAQFREISVAVEDSSIPILNVLREVDPSFQDVHHVFESGRAAAYRSNDGTRVEFLTPNRGRESETPVPLPALGTDAQPLRFLDYLIRDPVPAALLHGEGIYVSVPEPARFAFHKLIVAHRRPGLVKVRKDIQQAASLLDALASERPSDLREAWRELVERGPKWRKLAYEGLAMVAAETRDLVLATLGETRSRIPLLALTFPAGPARYDFDRMVVLFPAMENGRRVTCAISREALEDWFHGDRSDPHSVFVQHRTEIETAAAKRYVEGPIERDLGGGFAFVLLRTEDFHRSRRASRKRGRS